MKPQKKKRNTYERFLIRVNENKAWDLPIIAGAELLVLSIALTWKFLNSSWSDILKTENHPLFLFVIIGLFVVSVTALILILYGVVIKSNSRE